MKFQFSFDASGSTKLWKRVCEDAQFVADREHEAWSRTKIDSEEYSIQVYSKGNVKITCSVDGFVGILDIMRRMGVNMRTLEFKSMTPLAPGKFTREMSDELKLAEMIGDQFSLFFSKTVPNEEKARIGIVFALGMSLLLLPLANKEISADARSEHLERINNFAKLLIRNYGDDDVLRNLDHYFALEHERASLVLGKLVLDERRTKGRRSD